MIEQVKDGRTERTRILEAEEADPSVEGDLSLGVGMHFEVEGDEGRVRWEITTNHRNAIEGRRAILGFGFSEPEKAATGTQVVFAFAYTPKETIALKGIDEEDDEYDEIVAMTGAMPDPMHEDRIRTYWRDVELGDVTMEGLFEALQKGGAQAVFPQLHRVYDQTLL